MGNLLPRMKEREKTPRATTEILSHPRGSE
jgi:hypothetical protein